MHLILDIAAIQCIHMIEQRTGAHVRDCILGEKIIVIVEQNEIAKAIGKQGSTVKNLEQAFHKPVRIIEYTPDVLAFVKNVISPLQAEVMSADDGVVVLHAKDLKTRGMLIGRNASQLRGFESIIQRHFPIKELRVEELTY